jgi:2-oxoglutarate dehydrogenase E2 component (dihydrolipoamide succinyltransferase)
MPNIVVPQLGESIVEARVARWLKNAGDRVAAGEALVELETEKVDLEVNAERAGVLSSIAHFAGADVKVGEVLGVIDDSPSAAAGASTSAAKAGAESSGGGSAAPSTPAATTPAGPKSGESASPAAATPGVEPRATPTARRIAQQHDVDLGRVQGTGSGGRVTKQDVQGKISAGAVEQAGTGERAGTAEQAAAAMPGADAAPVANEAPAAPTPPVAPATATPTVTSPAVGTPPPSTAWAPLSIAEGDRPEQRSRMTKRRQTIARRLVEAQRTAAMLTTFNEVDMTAMMALRERHKESFKQRHGVGLGITSFFVKASVAALRAFPQLNAEIQGDEIVLKQYYDIGMAVGAEGGLVVPVLRNADRMSFAGLEQTIRDVAKRAADGSLTLEDLAGGTFTITNGGVFGSLLSTPILNPPQVGILGLHKIQDRVVPVSGQAVIRPMMYVALSYDHRIVDGREAVQFLVRIKEYVEDPGQLLLEG